MKTLVTYVFHQFNQRVQYFIDNAIFEDPDIDFLIVINDLDIKIDVPNHVKIFNRKNIGYDFGGWSEGIMTNDLYKNYTHFIFANSSIMGPYCKDKWTSIFLNGLTDSVKLFGPTINTCKDPLHKSHVQSYLFSMNLETLEFLISKGIFSITNYAINMNEAIWEREVPMSTHIIKNGWNIGSLMKQYQGIDFTFRTQNLNIEYLDDIMFPQEIGWNMFHEFVFIKGNRFGM